MFWHSPGAIRAAAMRNRVRRVFLPACSAHTVIMAARPGRSPRDFFTFVVTPLIISQGVIP